MHARWQFSRAEFQRMNFGPWKIVVPVVGVLLGLWAGLIAGLASGDLDRGPPNEGGLFLAEILGMAFLVLLLAFFSAVKLDRLMPDDCYDLLPVDAEVSDEGLRFRTPVSESFFGWAAFDPPVRKGRYMRLPLHGSQRTFLVPIAQVPPEFLDAVQARTPPAKAPVR